MRESAEEKLSKLNKVIKMLGGYIQTKFLSIRFVSSPEQNKPSMILWLTVLVLATAGLILWPFVFTLECKGIFFGSVSVLIGISIIVGLFFGIVSNLILDRSVGFIVGIIASITYVLSRVSDDFSGSVAFGSLLVSLFGIIGTRFPALFIAGSIVGFIIGIWLGLLIIAVANLFGSLIIGIIVSLAAGFIVVFDNLAIGLGLCVGVFVAVLIVVLLWHGLKSLYSGGIGSVKLFFTPWRSERLYFGRSVGFFVMLYMFFVLLFALWFYASYLNATKELPAMNEFFETQDIVATSNYWTFTYFSFITIASLGYGDIYPTHWISQILVILETMVGVGLIAGFLALIISVGGRGKGRTPERDLDDY